jgi:hypothetical protein
MNSEVQKFVTINGDLGFSYLGSNIISVPLQIVRSAELIKEM